MRKNKVLLIFLGLYLCVYLLLIQIGGALLIPLIANYSVSKYVPYNKSLEGIKVKLLPYPVVDVSRISFASPSFKIRASKIRIVPDIFHLIIGSPFLNITVGGCNVEFFYQNKAKEVSPPILLPRNKYLMHLFLNKGRTTIHFKNHIVKLNDIKANLFNKLGLRGEISASSPKAQNIYFKFCLKEDRLSFSSHIHNALIINYLSIYFPKISDWIEGKLKVDMCFKGKFYNNKLFIRAVIASPSIYLIKGCKMKNPYINMSIQTNLSSSHSIDVYIKKISILHPNIVIGGEIRYTDSKIKINLYAPTIDYTAWLKEYHKLGIKINIMESLSRIVKRGKIRNLRFYLSREEQHPMRWGLMGRGEDIAVLIPSVGLKLSHVGGSFSVKDKILYCSNASGKVKESKFYNANLILGLNPKISPFNLMVTTQFRLENLNSLLRQLHILENVQDKLEKLDIKKGRCRGWVHVWKDNSSFYVEVRARNISLQGEIKESRVPFYLKCGFFHLTTKTSYLTIKDIKGNIGSSKITVDIFSVDMYKEKLSIEMASKYISIPQIGYIVSYIFNVPSILRYIEKGSIELSSFNCDLNYATKQIMSLNASGVINTIQLKRYFFTRVLKRDNIPFRYLYLSKGKFSIFSNKFFLKNLHVRARDSYLFLRKADFIRGDTGIDVTLAGNARIGRDAQFIIKQEATFLKKIKLRHLLNIKSFHITYLHEKSISLDLSLILGPSSIMNIYVCRMKKSNIIKGKIQIKKHERENLFITYIKRDKIILLKFKGILCHRDLDYIFLKNPWIKNKIEGNFFLEINLSPSSINLFKGKLSIYDMTTRISGLSFSIKRAQFNGKGKRIEIRNGEIGLDGNVLYPKGQIYLLKRGTFLDLDIRGKNLDLDHLISSFNTPNTIGKKENPWGICGKINFKIDHLIFLNRNIKRIRALLKIKSNNHVLILINKSYLGGLFLKGEANISSEKLKFFLSGTTKTDPVDMILKEIFKTNKNIITGKAKIEMRLKGTIPLNKKHSSLYNYLSGSINLSLKTGRIYKLTLLSRIFAILNSTEILFGNVPSLDKEGFGYTTVNSKAKIENGVLTIERSVINGDTMDIIFHGKIYLTTASLNMLAFIAPLKTIDRLVKKIPVVNSILKGHFLLIPVSITGKVNDPIVIPISPTALSSEILQVLKNIIKLPFSIFQPAN